MMKYAVIALLALILLLPAGCKNSASIDAEAGNKGNSNLQGITTANSTSPEKTPGIFSKQNTELAGIYIKAIEYLLNTDTALNKDMKFIAVDFKTLKGISEADCKEIASYLEGKYTKVKNASKEDLKREGEFNEKGLFIKNGVAIKVDKIIEFSDKCINFEASKYKSGLAAVGIAFKFEKRNNKWENIDACLRWIS